MRVSSNRILVELRNPTERKVVANDYDAPRLGAHLTTSKSAGLSWITTRGRIGLKRNWRWSTLERMLIRRAVIALEQAGCGFVAFDLTSLGIPLHLAACFVRDHGELNSSR